MDLGSGVSLQPQIDLEFADGEYTFALKLPQLIELEDRCAFVGADGGRRRKGVVAIYGDVLAGLVVVDGNLVAVMQEGRASAFECREVIRLGLIGGGMGSTKATDLCERYVDTAPLVFRWTTAAAILRAAVEGYEPKKAEPAPAGAPDRRSQSTRARSSSTAG